MHYVGGRNRVPNHNTSPTLPYSSSHSVTNHVHAFTPCCSVDDANAPFYVRPYARPDA